MESLQLNSSPVKFNVIFLQKKKKSYQVWSSKQVRKNELYIWEILWKILNFLFSKGHFQHQNVNFHDFLKIF